MKIGVFDSGVGGLSVAKAIEKALPEHEIVFLNDSQHVPYGTKSPDEIFEFVVPVLEELIEQGCRVIVVACNTVTTTLIDRLRKRFDNIPLVAVEPMVKPAAAMTKNKVIAVCATPTTLASQRYKWLKDTYAKGVKVLEPDCSGWVLMIERNRAEDSEIGQHIESVIEAGADVIVLGCTHYHWIEEDVRQVANGRAEVIQPEQALIAQLKRVLAQLA